MKIFSFFPIHVFTLKHILGANVSYCSMTEGYECDKCTYYHSHS